MQQSDLLKSIVELAEAKKRDLALVFDLDSTLFDVAPRITQIFREFAIDQEMNKLFPKECEKLTDFVHHKNDWGVRKACERVGLTNSTDDFYESIKKYWADRFHSSNYLHHDVPTEGAVAYVQAVHSAGAEIIYLTGRDQDRYTEGTVRILNEHQFPLGERAKTALKPHLSMADAPYKKDSLAELQNHHSEIWFFENEPVNTNLVAKELPDINIVFFELTHSGKEEPHPDHPVITSFRY